MGPPNQVDEIFVGHWIAVFEIFNWPDSYGCNNCDTGPMVRLLVTAVPGYDNPEKELSAMR